MEKETRDALETVGKASSKFMQKRYTLPMWVLLSIAALFVFGINFSDQGSYYYKREDSQQVVTDSILEAAALSGGPINGIDVSKWQGTVIDWDAVARSGIEFVIIKATEGTTYVDPCFTTNWDGAKQAGLLVSAYHMLWPKLDALKQARHFLDTLGDRRSDFPLALDVEKRTTGNIGSVVESILLALEAEDGRKPFVYTAQSVWGDLVGWAPGWHEYPLWVADYDAVVPAMPTGWDTYAMWQHSSTGAVPGIAGNVDLNMFVAGREALAGLGR